MHFSCQSNFTYSIIMQTKIKALINSFQISPYRLRKLADWFDHYDDAHNEENRDVQSDLRTLANQMEELLEIVNRKENLK